MPKKAFIKQWLALRRRGVCIPAGPAGPGAETAPPAVQGLLEMLGDSGPGYQPEPEPWGKQPTSQLKAEESELLSSFILALLLFKK